tara:strand:- start:4514 stop:4810 length:297 start_codon:yes stop_codon:yes gene_type:complete
MAIMTTLASVLVPIIANEIAKSVDKMEKGGVITRNKMVMVHKGEFVLPANVKPTPKQRKAVAKGKAVGFRKPVAKKAPVKRKPGVRKPIGNQLKKKRK